MYRTPGIPSTGRRRRSQRTSIQFPVLTSVIAQPQHNDIFPLLDFKEISVCLQGCDFTASEELLNRPTTQYIQSLFEQILDSFLGISTHNLGPALSAAAETAGVNQSAADFGGSTSDIQVDARMTLVLQRSIYRFMVDCGIDDFSIMDIVKPEPQRLRRLLSAVVNFARFREEHMGDCEDLVQRSEQSAEHFRALMSDHEDLTAKVDELERVSKNSQEKVKLMETHNSEVEGELRQLKKVQEQLTLEHGLYKQEKARLVSKLEDQSFLIVEGRKENDKIRPYIVESPEILHKINSDMAASLSADKAALETAEHRARALEVSIESLRNIEADMRKCIKVTEECEAELQREEEAVRKLMRLQEVYEQRKLDSQELDRRLQQLERQIVSAEDRIERARNQAEQKRKAAQQKMSDLRDTFATLQAERSVHDQDMDKKRSYIALTEQKMADMRQDLENEMRAVSAESEKLQAHINVYLNDMEQRVIVST